MITDVFPAWNAIPENNIFIKKVFIYFQKHHIYQFIATPFEIFNIS